ncbi:HAD family hydrolase [Vibrio europaeus]|uniref:HAD family hydrolase n=1 Tax=Vibrio europaeus TaxID=300876 RepID=A0AAE7AY08_9VIBR|nr:HAD family hydrolase [Vibrio europaeus]MDC5812477.1 HAD family hydrolase [Vibrio europaeus]QJY38882.1 HAD family hydrolase [Vibrio europaeus]QPG33904.1 HAD family hydrolase [Vibrio europaeus]
MLKAIFFDMDETLCGTSKADNLAGQSFARWIKQTYPQLTDEQRFFQRYLAGVYKQLNAEFPQLVDLLPNEAAFRCGLIRTLLAEQGVEVDEAEAQIAQAYFDHQRIEAFGFFPGGGELLTSLRERYTLVVITNGPTFSQYPKLAAVNMSEWVDHIIVGGEEPEEKPAASIFQKALDLSGTKPEEVIHIGDSLPSDIAGANQMGIISVWVDASGNGKSGDIIPSYTVRTATDLPAILAAL